MKELFGIEDEVERRLQEAQKNKEFKDAGERVGGSNKEKRALNAIVKTSDLANLEKDDATAIETIVKDRVWPKVIAENELDDGVSSGCAFMKHAIRAAYGAKPQENTHAARRAYIGLAEKLQQMLTECYTIQDMASLSVKIKAWRGSQVSFLLDEQILESYTDQDIDNRYSGYTLLSIFYSMIARECSNIIFRESEAGKKVWAKALQCESVSEEQEKHFREQYEQNYRAKIDEVQKKIVIYSTADTNKLRELKRAWSGVPSDLHEFRDRALQHYSQKVAEFEHALQNFPDNLKQREADWSWAESKKRGKADRPELIINQPPPLSFIKRTGGLEITKVSQQEIIDQFGFKYVEFGNSISDKEAREHVRHFLGALVDLFEVLNLNQKEINKLGDLSIAFASRGRKGSSAHYERLRRIININRRNGDGSVAHEWMHYLDHLFWQKFKRFDQTDLYKLASEVPNLLIDTESTRAFKDLCEMIRRGDGKSKKVKAEFFADKSHNFRGAMKEDLNATLLFLKHRYRYLFEDSQHNSYRDAGRVFGYVAHHFNQPSITIEREITKSSLFYYYSAKMSSSYWIKPQELLARAFETFIYDKLTHLDRYNNYLVNSEFYDDNPGIYPFGDERELFLLKFNTFFAALKKDLSITPFFAFTDRRTEEYIVLAAQEEEADEEEQQQEKVEGGVVVASDLSELLRLEISLIKAA